MLRDVFPVNRKKLALDIVKHVEESRRSTISFCAADKIACSVMRLLKTNKLYNRLSLFGKGKGEMILEKTYKILPVAADAPDVRVDVDLPVDVPDVSVRMAELKGRIEATKSCMEATKEMMQIMLVKDESELRTLQPNENR